MWWGTSVSHANVWTIPSHCIDPTRRGTSHIANRTGHLRILNVTKNVLRWPRVAMGLRFFGTGAQHHAQIIVQIGIWSAFVSKV